MKRTGQGLCAVIVGLFIAAQVYAWQNKYLLPGTTFLRFFSYKLYSPHDYLLWLWRWVFTYPASFQFSGVSLLITIALCMLLFHPKPSSTKPVAVWATLKTLKKAGVIRHDGLQLGVFSGKIVRAWEPGHFFSVASTQTGKTAGILIPSLLGNRDKPSIFLLFLCWLFRNKVLLQGGLDKASVIIHDPKEPAEIYENTAGYRSTFSKVILFQPLSSTSQQYNPLDAVRFHTEYKVRDLQIIAEMLGDPDGDASKRKDEGTMHFSQIAADFNTGCLTHAFHTWPGFTLEDMYVLMLNIEKLVDEMEKAQHLNGSPDPLCVRAVQVYRMTADRELSAFRNTAQRAFRLWADPLVCRATARSDFSLHDLREGSKPLSLYLSFPFADQERLRPLSRLIIRQCLEYAAHRKNNTSKPKPNDWKFPLVAVLDEFQALGYLPILRYGITYFLGMGVSLCLITPSLHEIVGIWGQHHPFMEGTATKVAFGIRDKGIAKQLTESIGTHPVPYERTSRSNYGSFSSTVMREEKDEELFSAQALRQLSPDKLLALIAEQQVILEKTPFYDNPLLLKRSKMEVKS